MSTRTVVAAGLWSNPAIWDGGVALPAAGDTVVGLLGAMVTIDQDIDVGSIGTPSGGGFSASIPAGSVRNIKADIIAGTEVCLALSGDGEAAIVGNVIGGTSEIRHGISAVCARTTIAGNVTGGAGSKSVGVKCTNSARVIEITGTVTGGSSTSDANGVESPGPITITGNVHGGTAGRYNYGVVGTGSSNVTVTGDVHGGIAEGCAGLSSSTGLVTVYGNVAGGSASNCYGVDAPNVTVTGDVTGGSGVDARGLLHTGPAHISGNVVGGSGDNSPGIYGYADALIEGDVTGGAGVGSSGVVLESGATVSIGGMATNTPTNVAVRANSWRAIAGRALVVRIWDDANPPALRVLTTDPWATEIAPGVTARDRLLATATVDSTGAQIAAATTA